LAACRRQGPAAAPRDPFGFSWNAAVLRQKPPSAAIGFSWISLDSLVRIETFQWVTRRFRDHNYSCAFPLVVEAWERTPSVKAMRQGMIVHAANLAVFLIFVNRLLLNRK
jgi:hypothetical protein